MLGIRFLIKTSSRSFAQIQGVKKAIIDMKFLSSKNFNSFLDDIDIPRASLPILAYTLKIAKDVPKNSLIEARGKLYQIISEVENNLNKLDSQGVLNYCEWISGSGKSFNAYYLPRNKKKILISRINELISSHSFSRKQILWIYENVVPLGFFIEEIKNEIEKIVNDSSSLTLEEISQIFIGCGKHLFSSEKFMSRILQLSSQEELDMKSLAKILHSLSKIEFKESFKIFAKAIEKTIPRWKDNDLLLVLEFYKNHNRFGLNTYFQVLERVDKLLEDEQPIEFVIKLAFLLKEESKNVIIIEKIISKCFKIIKSKLSCKFIGVENLKEILDLLKPIIDSQTAQLLAEQLKNTTSLPDQSLELFQKATKIFINNKGKLIPLTDFIIVKKLINIDGTKIKYLEFSCKLDILRTIESSKASQLYGLGKIKDVLIDDLKVWLSLRRANISKFCQLISYNDYSSKYSKVLKPLQHEVYNSLKTWDSSINRLYFSMLFYESDPAKWEDFFIENKKLFSSEEVWKAIRFYKGSFKAIIFILQAYKNNLSTRWISESMKRIIEVHDAEVLNDFAQILNRMDPHYLLNEEYIYQQNQCFSHLLANSDFSIMEDLFAGASNLLKDSPIETIFSKNNIKILFLAAILGKLDAELADKIVSNYAYMKKTDWWSILAISSKCSDMKLRESLIKNIFNDKLEPRFIIRAIDKYWYHPETKEIDRFISNFLNKTISNLERSNGIFYMIAMLRRLWEVNINQHLDLFKTISSLTKKLILQNIGYLNFTDLDFMLNLANKEMFEDLNFGFIISKNNINSKYQNSESSRDMLIEKMKTVGISSKDAVLAVCNNADNFSSSYLARTISCLADLRFEKQKWATDMAQNLIDYAENKEIVFQNDLEHINWIYGLISFNADKSTIMRHIENSQYFDCEQPTFKHFLLANHIRMDPDFKGVDILDQKTRQYWREFDYFNYFGIDTSFINLIKSALNKSDFTVKTESFIDGIWLPFYIPNRKIVLWPKTNSIFLYHSNNFKGEFNMHRNHILRKLNDVLILNREDVNQIEKLKQFLNI
ncbi:unnamed protein product [Blepharisma stoltei]|uniref:Uncharacterized protein n=1 Tax=Blepharisma stoltei TaxID=1481888 RepID=A0AAU9J8T7_9CILI|nr:unnamed protein product [Blepharisma stoltei]